jgi:tetrapyrrole methylase family protein / MazG family protein
MTLTIVGLGPGHIDDLSRRAWRTLENSKMVYLRTNRHPCVHHLPPGPMYHSFDEVYEANADFDQVYATIVERIITAAKFSDVVYAVPGDPMVGESTVTRLLEAARAASIPLEIVSGISFIEAVLKVYRHDALDGLQILDALEVAAMHHPPINPDYPALLGQVYSREVASNVKLTLMNQYPDDFKVDLVHAAGTDNQFIEVLPLYELDHSDRIDHLTALVVPALGKMSSFEQFQEIIAHLRAPEGCPWDREQTHLSLRQYLIEETYEVLEAIDAGDSQALREELGDLLIQVALHTQVAIDEGEFNMTDVLSHVSRKLIRRHPHVWGDVQVDGAADVLANWDALKQQEQAQQGKQRKSLLDGVPKGLPALLQAYKYQSKVPHFDWTDANDVLAKVREELAEVQAATSVEERTNELGDLLFTIVNWGRWLGIADPESALRDANLKFYKRFRYIEDAIAAAGKLMSDYSLEELDALWDEGKAKGL